MASDNIFTNGDSFQRGIMRIQNNAQLAEVERKQEEEKKAQEAEVNKELLTNLASYLNKMWDSAYYAKNTTLTPLMLECERQRRGLYAPERLAKIRKQGGSEAFVRITAWKCLAMEAWIKDTLMPTDGNPWSIEPTPMPNLNPSLKDSVNQKAVEFSQAYYAEKQTPPSPSEVQTFKENMENILLRTEQERANYAAERMTKLIEDQLLEGGFQGAFDSFLHYLTTYPFSVLKGPIFRMENQLEWVEQADGTFQPEKKREVKMKFEAVAPYDLYLSPMAKDVQSGFLFECMKMSRADLLSMKGLPGYRDDMIDECIRRYGDNGLSRTQFYPSWTRATNQLKQPQLQTSNSSDITIEALEFHGSVRGKYLKEWGMEIADETAEYVIWAILIGDYVIKAELNPDPMGKRPYYLTCVEKMPETPYGLGICQKMSANQESINACRRSMINNMAIASGPQVVVNTAMLSPGEDITALSPWKIWQYHDDKGLASKPIDFFNPNNNAQVLNSISDALKAEVDDDTSVPRFEHGNSGQGGAAGTARGLSMLMNAATKTIKQVIKNIDTDVIEPLIGALYRYNMQYSKDNSVKGDMQIKVRGATDLAVKEQTNAMRLDFLNMMIQNPSLAELIGQDGVLKILRESIKGLNMPVDSIIPTDAEIAKKKQEADRAKQMEQQAQLGLIQAQADQAQGRATKAEADAMAKTAQSQRDNMQFMNGQPLNPGQQDMGPLPPPGTGMGAPVPQIGMS